MKLKKDSMENNGKYTGFRRNSLICQKHLIKER